MSPRDSRSGRTSLHWGRVAIGLLASIAIVVAVGAGTGVLPIQVQSSTQTISNPNRGDFDIGAWGRLAPRGEVRSLGAPSTAEGARIAKLNVHEGQRVAEGEVIAVLDSHDRRLAAVEHARSLLSLAEARLEQTRVPAKPSEIAAQEALIARLKHEQTQAEADLRREQALGKISVEATLEQLKLKAVQAAQNRIQAEAQLESLKTPRPVDIAVAERQVDEARALLRQAETDLAMTEIRSPCAATVLRIHSRSGERVGNHGVVSIGDLDQMYAVAEVYEADLVRLRIGQTATVHIPTLKHDLSGEVERLGYVVQRKDVFNIDPVADTDARVVEVWIRLPQDVPQAVRQLSNARVEVIIHVDQKISDEAPKVEPISSPASIEVPTASDSKKEELRTASDSTETRTAVGESPTNEVP